jgi:hypothetical protein
MPKRTDAFPADFAEAGCGVVLIVSAGAPSTAGWKDRYKNKEWVSYAAHAPATRTSQLATDRGCHHQLAQEVFGLVRLARSAASRLAETPANSFPVVRRDRGRQEIGARGLHCAPAQRLQNAHAYRHAQRQLYGHGSLISFPITSFLQRTTLRGLWKRRGAATARADL